MGNNQVCISVVEMGKRIGLSRACAYELARRNDFPAIRIGKRILVPVEALSRWVNEHAENKQSI